MLDNGEITVKRLGTPGLVSHRVYITYCNCWSSCRYVITFNIVMYNCLFYLKIIID